MLVENQDKVLNMLEKIYEELQDTKKELKADILAIETKIENEVSDKVRALYDHREIVNSKLDEIDEKVDKLHLDINNLTLKVVQSDSQIVELKRNFKNAK